MGIRGELFSTKFSCDARTYFFNVKQNRNGDVFLSIVESKPSEGESFDRRSIVIFGDRMEEFLKSFQAALKFIDKTGIKVDPDPSVHSYSAEEGGERRRSPDGGEHRRKSEETGERRSRSDDSGERHYKSDDSRPRRDSPREGRASSYREHGGSDARQATRRTVSRPGAPAERSSGRPATRGAPAPAERASGRPITRASSLPSTRGSTDKPVKRIIVRKAKKPSSGD